MWLGWDPRPLICWGAVGAHTWFRANARSLPLAVRTGKPEDAPPLPVTLLPGFFELASART